ncbi:hypothetical protein QWJ41_19755 [Nocardioides sp. SOB44]|uniref:Uncharacterized protein n=1 Tax=Nocardioides cremeus TaxID=3058044 RepID=A0ABT8TY79_9ACTN|nr:hypothetical protein [Nocardioides cremeus]MDO3397968.1 hypothetical protein [Nocardioides cremeus]
MHTTDAHALQAILAELNSPASGSSLNARWAKALGVQPGAAGFPRRHAEVMNLLAETIRQIGVLPPARRGNYEPSAPLWWKAVVAPDIAWGAGNTTGPIIGQEHIALLGSMGDVIEARQEGTALAPGGVNLEALTDQCKEWIEVLQGTHLPNGLRTLLIESLEHVIWLADSVDRFGYARVAREAESVTGALVLATPQVPDEARPSWNQRFRRWTATLATFTLLASGTQLAIEGATDVVNEVAPAVGQVIEMIEGSDDSTPSTE